MIYIVLFFIFYQDLNRVKNKPYTQTVDSDGRRDEVSKFENAFNSSCFQMNYLQLSSLFVLLNFWLWNSI